MQNKGLIRVFAILFGLVCLYQLSYTFITNSKEGDAEAYANAKFAEGTKDYAKLREEAQKTYLDSIGNDTIALGITYNSAKKKELNKVLPYITPRLYSFEGERVNGLNKVSLCQS